MPSRINIKNYKRVVSFFKRNGLKASVVKVFERLARDDDEKDYTQKVLSELIDDKTASLQREHIFSNRYLISIVVPVFEPDEEVFIKMLNSVIDSTYTGWEMCIADGSASDKYQEMAHSIFATEGLEGKLRYKRISENHGISANMNEALSMASGEYVTFLDHDDVITKDALYTVISVLNNESEYTHNPNVRKRFIYSDEDKVSFDDSYYFDHHKKTDFDRIMLLTNNYICHLLVVDTDLARAVGGFDSDYDGSQDFDFVLKISEQLKDEEIVHIPKVLYHWRSTKASTAENPDAKLYAYEAGKRAVAAHLKRQGINAYVTNTPHLGFFGINFGKSSINVRIITPSEFENLNRETLEGISQSYIMVVSEDLECDCEEYLSELLGPMVIPFVGATTGKITKGSRIESAGYELDMTDGKKPQFSGMNKMFSGYLHRASILRQITAFDEGFVMYKKDALNWDNDRLGLSESFSCVYVPEVVFRRK